MTPNDIEVLIHFHCSPCRHPNDAAPAVRESIEMMIENGLLERDTKPDEPMRFKTTSRGAAHLDQLCNVPFPRRGWIFADGNFFVD